jgi:outer membrane protein assembly factor BamB
MAWIQLFPVLGCVGTLCLACSCEEHEHAADASPRPDRSIPDAGPDLSPPKEDAGSPWKRDLGPDPDLNLAMCSDGSVAVDPSDLAVSLDTTPDLKWTVSLHKGNGAPTSPVLDHDGTVYLPTLKGLFAVSSAGKLAWSLPPPGGSFLLGGHGGLFNGTFVTGAQHTIHGIDVKKQTFWTIPLQGPLDSLTKTAGMFHTSAPGLLTPGTVAVAGADHRLYRMTLGGKLLGTSMMPGIASLPRFPAMDVAGNTYFSIIASGARLASFGPEGKLRWMRSLQPIPRSSVLSVAVGGPSTVVVASYNGTVPQPGTEVFTTDVAALDSGCGAERWRVTLDGIPRSQLLVGRVATRT